MPTKLSPSIGVVNQTGMVKYTQSSNYQSFESCIGSVTFVGLLCLDNIGRGMGELFQRESENGRHAGRTSQGGTGGEKGEGEGGGGEQKNKRKKDGRERVDSFPIS